MTRVLPDGRKDDSAVRHEFWRALGPEGIAAWETVQEQHVFRGRDYPGRLQRSVVRIIRRGNPQ